MNEYVIVIFGASGDLVKRKLLPGLYNLIKKNDIEHFCIVGAAYDAIDVAAILERAKEHVQDGVDQAIWQRIQERFSYQQLNFKERADYDALKKHIDQQKEHFHLAKASTLIYFAAAAHFFCDLTRLCAQARIAERVAHGKTPWTRLVYEKPFGYDLASAQEINRCIATYFDESQIFRIDHYLTKELVSSIASVRFANAVFEPLWNNRYVDHVQIVLNEKDGIGNRGAYYDKFGAMSDVMQNHMLELLAIIGMEPPEKFKGKYIRDERVKVLEKIKVIDAFVAQYDTYKNEPQVDPDSTTETFAAAYLRIENKRWAGVPFYLKTGKCLKEKSTAIHIKFKSVGELLAHRATAANVLTIDISPVAGFSLQLNAKKPGEMNELIPVTMDFCHSCLFGLYEGQAYQALLEGVFEDQLSISVRFDEIEASWRIIDTIKKQKHVLHTYACDSAGPQALEQFDKKHGIRWFS